MTAQPKDVAALVERIKPLLAGKLPELQGAVLADLLAIWVAGHVIQDDAGATHKLRNFLLAEHFKVVRRLVKVNAKLMGTD